MSNMRGIRFWKNWGLVSRLMLAVGIAIITGGGVQTALLVAEGAAEHSARLKRELNETLTFMAPLIADQALVGRIRGDQPAAQEPGAERRDRQLPVDRQGRQEAGRAGQARYAERAVVVHRARRDRPGGRKHRGHRGRRRLRPAQCRDGHHQGVQPPVAAVRQAAADRRGHAVPHAAVHLAHLPRQPRHAAHAGGRRQPLQPGRLRGAHRARRVAGSQLGRRSVQQHGEQHRKPDRLSRQKRIEEQAARDHRRAVERSDLDHATSPAPLPAGTRAPPPCSAIRRPRPWAMR